MLFRSKRQPGGVRSAQTLGLMSGNHAFSTRSGQFAASAAGIVLIVCLVTPLVAWLIPTDSFAIVAIGANGIAILFAAAEWTGVLRRWETEPAPRPLSPWEWIGVFFLSLAISVLFIFMDCGWHIPWPHEKFICDGHPGLSLIFTFAAVCLTIISLPSAVRAYLLRVLAAKRESNGKNEA